MSEFLDVLRTEKKYTVSPLTAGQITARLSYLLPLDGNCENAKPYIVKSLYFDSLYNRDYMEKPFVVKADCKDEMLELKEKIETLITISKQPKA